MIGDEARDDDRLGAVSLVETMRAVEVLAVQEADALLAEDLWADAVADRVVHRVSRDRRHAQQEEHQAQVERAARRERPHREQEGVSRQDRRHHQSCLAEDDQEQDQVGPHPIILDDGAEVAVEVQDDIDELAYQVHGRDSYTALRPRSRELLDIMQAVLDPRHITSITTGHRGDS